MKAREVNFDGLVGLTHHYAGLSFGNEASTKHRFQVSNPKLAAKQGLLKMKALSDAGFPQAVIPPQERPNVAVLQPSPRPTESAPARFERASPYGQRASARARPPRPFSDSPPKPPPSRRRRIRWTAKCI